MKQKIVIKLQVNCDSRRSKAMKIAANFSGVSKVEIQGKDRDELAVIAEGVDSVKLTQSLRKKLCYAMVLSVQEEKKKETKEEKPKYICYPYTYTYPYTPNPPAYARVCDEPGPDDLTCSIM